MIKSPAFSFYVRDWLCSTTIARMTGEQVKAYVYLLCAAWLEDDTATLPSDDESLAALARVDLATWHRIKPLILSKFHDAGNGRLYNDRQYAERLKQQRRSQAATQREHKRSTVRAQLTHSHSTALEDEDEDANEDAKGKGREREGVLS
jgi:uncharacterized protein YdaU (DUF1376 family)